MWIRFFTYQEIFPAKITIITLNPLNIYLFIGILNTVIRPRKEAPATTCDKEHRRATATHYMPIPYRTDTLYRLPRCVYMYNVVA